MKLLIIGSGAAGSTAAQFARKANMKAEITILGDEHYSEYSKCGLPYVFGGIIPDFEELIEFSTAWFQRFKIDLQLERDVYAIDTEKKIVKSLSLQGGDERAYEYDALIIATGARSWVPEIKGAYSSDGKLKEGVFTLRDMADAKQIMAWAKKSKRGMIAGSGLVGMEMAEALARMGIDTYVRLRTHMLTGMIDEDMAGIVQKNAELEGIKFLPRVTVSEIKGSDMMECVVLKNLDTGEETDYPMDLLIISAGSTARTEVAEKAGCKIGSTGGIVIDEKGQTSVKDIYAAGDVVEKHNLISGKKMLLALAGPANREGRVAGCNAAGGNMSFPGVIGTSIVGFNVLAGGIAVAGTGLTYEQALKEGFDADYTYTCDPQHVSYYPNPKYIFLQMIFDKSTGRVLGAFASGFEDVARKIDVIATAIYNNMTIDDLAYVDYCYAPGYGAAKDNVNIAAYVASNIKDREYGSISPEKFLELYTQNKDLQILDVRSAPEVKVEKINNSIHIYINDLRNNFDLLDKNREIYVYCEVGFRGYISTRILKQYGFKAYNIRGGIDATKRIYKRYDMENIITTNN